MRLWMLVLPLLLAACDSKGDGPGPANPGAVVDRAKDPVCGMMVDKAGSLKTVHEKSTYYFCADDCLKKFQAEPAKHASPCACGKTSKKCPCGHCGTKGDTCDCS